MSECSDECICVCCQAKKDGLTQDQIFKRLQETQAENIEKYGFCIHYVSDSDSPELINAHTHGISSSFDHKDFQIVLNLHPSVVQSIFFNLVESLKSGNRFEHNQKVNEIIRYFQIKLIDAVEDGRQVLRVILPDPDGNTDKDKMSLEYARQYPEKPSWKTLLPNNGYGGS